MDEPSTAVILYKLTGRQVSVPVPPISRRPSPPPEPLSPETRSRLLLAAVLNTKIYKA